MMDSEKAETEEVLTNSLKKGFMEPLKEMVERLKTESELREKTQEARYSLTQKKLDIIEEKVDKAIKLLENNT